MFGTYFFVFFEGSEKEAVAWDFKELVEGLLGEEAGVGRAFERPWEDREIVKRTRTATAPGDPGHDGPWSFARCVFDFPTYEEHYREEFSDEEPFDVEDFYEEDDGQGPREPRASLLGDEPFEEEDSSLYLFGADMPPEWRDAPVTISFPPFALPAQTSEERQASRPKAKRVLRWLVRVQRRRKVTVQISAGFFAPIYLDPQELTAARLLTMALELQEITPPEDTQDPASLELNLALEDPESRWEEPKDQPQWPARL